MRDAFSEPPKAAGHRRLISRFAGGFALWLLFLMLPAHAHDAGVSSSEISVNGRIVAVEINALARDYEKAAAVLSLIHI